LGRQVGHPREIAGGKKRHKRDSGEKILRSGKASKIKEVRDEAFDKTSLLKQEGVLGGEERKGQRIRGTKLRSPRLPPDLGESVRTKKMQTRYKIFGGGEHSQERGERKAFRALTEGGRVGGLVREIT